MNETLNVLKTRRSCRAFKPDMVKEEDLKAIIEAGTYAATGMGKQSPIIIAVTDKALRDEIAEENRILSTELPLSLSFLLIRMFPHMYMTDLL